MSKKKKTQNEDIQKDPFEEYFRIREPDKADKVYAWQTAVGLQDVDKLSPSEYLLKTARENIEGEISIEEAKKRIESYYEESSHQTAVSSRTKANIILLREAFGNEKIFGRGDVVEILGITEKPASTLLGKMHTLHLTERITGAGKGKYRFIV